MVETLVCLAVALLAVFFVLWHLAPTRRPKIELKDGPTTNWINGAFLIKNLRHTSNGAPQITLQVYCSACRKFRPVTWSGRLPMPLGECEFHSPK